MSFCEICLSSLQDNLVSILLVGSTARGELTYNQDELGNLHFYSDLEFYVYVKQGPDPLTRRIIDKKIEILQRPFTQLSPFFHIDISITPIHLLKRRNTKFITFENKVTGKVLYGIDIKPKLTTVTGSNLNFQELNEVLLHRLWSILLYLPVAFLRDHINFLNFNYILSRNVLDITTWLLPYENKNLLPGFKNRLSYINEKWNNLGFRHFFSQDDLQFLNQCYDGKMFLKFTETSTPMYKKSIQMFEQAIRYMLYKNGIVSYNDIYQKYIRSHSKKLFEGQTVKKKIVETCMLKDKIAKTPKLKLLKWIFQDKRALSVLFNLNMHLANISYIESRNDCFMLLEKAESFFQKLSLDYIKKKEKGYIDRWIQLRKGYVDYLVHYQKGYTTKKDYFYSIIGINKDDNYK